MLGFNHTLAGSIVAVLTPAPLVPVVALASHFVLDTFPHFGNSKTVHPYTRRFKVLLVADAILSLTALGFAIWLFPDKWFIVCVGAFFSFLPDFLWLLEHHGPKWFDAFLDWAKWIQWGERPFGWLFDVFYAFLMSFFLIVMSQR